MMRAVKIALLLLLSQACTSRNPEYYAKEWCRLNALILNHTGEVRTGYLKEVLALEKEVKALYPEGSAERTFILEKTYECD